MLATHNRHSQDSARILKHINKIEHTYTSCLLQMDILFGIFKRTGSSKAWQTNTVASVVTLANPNRRAEFVRIFERFIKIFSPTYYIQKCVKSVHLFIKDLITIFILALRYISPEVVEALLQVLTNNFERNLKIGAQWLDRKLGHALSVSGSFTMFF